MLQTHTQQPPAQSAEETVAVISSTNSLDGGEQSGMAEPLNLQPQPTAAQNMMERRGREQAAAHLKVLRGQMPNEQGSVAAFSARSGLPSLRIFAIESGQGGNVTTAEVMGYVSALGMRTADILGGMTEPGRSYLAGMLGVPAYGGGRPKGEQRQGGQQNPMPKPRPLASVGLTGEVKGEQEFEWGVARKAGQIAFADVRRCIPAFFSKLANDRDLPEMVFSWTSPGNIMVKVYTTIVAKTGLMPRAGNMPIRIILIDLESYKKIGAWTVKVPRGDDMLECLRVETGRAVTRASNRPECPRCKSEMRFVAPAENIEFFGCKSYPKCTARLRPRS